MENKTLGYTPPISLDEYINDYKRRKEKEIAFLTRSTNIKCEKCDGIYHHVNSSMVYQSNPPKKAVICNKCKDEQFIPC